MTLERSICDYSDNKDCSDICEGNDICDKTQHATKLKKSNCDQTQKLKNSNGDKTQKLELWPN